MADIILQAIKLTPRIFFQLFFQPSKVYAFINEGKKNTYIFTWASFFSGLLLGVILAVPHYHLYNNFSQSSLFAFTFAINAAFGGAIAVVFANALKNENIKISIITVVFLFTSAFAVAVVNSGVGIFAFAFVGVGSIAGMFGFALAEAIKSKNYSDMDMPKDVEFIFLMLIIAGIAISNGAGKLLVKFLLQPYSIYIVLAFSGLSWLIFYLAFKDKLKLSINKTLLLFVAAPIFLILACGGGIASIRPYEIIAYPIPFLIGYIATSSFYFIERSERFDKRYNHHYTQKNGRSRLKPGNIHKTGPFWGLLTVFYLSFLNSFNKQIDGFNFKIFALYFVVIIPIFTLHIPDYLFCLSLWFRQRKKILEGRENNLELIKNYEQSILFKHEMLYFQLPGLHNVMVFFAKNTEIGVNEALKHIIHLYWFTSQQKQAMKAIVELGKDKEIAQELILLLLEANEFLLLRKLAKVNRLAELHLTFFEEEDITELDIKDEDILFLRLEVFFFITEEKIIFKSGSLAELIDFVCLEMTKEKGYLFNDALIKTFKVTQKLLTALRLKDFYEAISELEKIAEFPKGLKYSSTIENLVLRLKIIRDSLIKIETFERFEIKRDILAAKKQDIVALSKTLEENLFEPFKYIWEKALNYCAGLVQQEIRLKQGSASLSIELKNSKILTSKEERKLYFNIHNQGQDLATDVLITLQADSPELVFSGINEAGIAVVESGTVKEISFPFTANTTIKTTVKGTLTFSDRSREGKKVSFSFPVEILEKIVEFKEIKNPYIVGHPLKGDTSLFFGREDISGFIDKNIMASGDFRSIVCHGLHRTGKSSLLYRFEEQGFTNKNLVPINLDIQGIDDEKDFYSTLSNTILEKLSLQSMSTVESFSQFKEFIKKIRPGLGERLIVLMIDEFEELQMRVEEKRISKTIFSNIRHFRPPDLGDFFVIPIYKKSPYQSPEK